MKIGFNDLSLSLKIAVVGTWLMLAAWAFNIYVVFGGVN